MRGFGRSGLGWQTETVRDPVPVHVQSTMVARRPGDHHEGIHPMKTGIHPDYVVTEVTCSCGNTFTTRSTANSGHIHADICSACHPFYTGKQKILDVGGRVDRFEKRYGKRVRSTNS
jgi:large subunit ribosomal protein L31